MVKLRNQQGATSLAEYGVTILLVVGALSIMTTYVKRALQARERDARHYMIDMVSGECNENCMRASNLVGRASIGEQYEPYYTQVSSSQISDRIDEKGLAASSVGKSGQFIGRKSSQGDAESVSIQLPPKEAVNDVILGSQ